jgi:hypothetical protein
MLAAFTTCSIVLNRARWAPLPARRQLLTLLIDTFVQAGGSLDSVIDATLERRWGQRSAHEDTLATAPAPVTSAR